MNPIAYAHGEVGRGEYGNTRLPSSPFWKPSLKGLTRAQWVAEAAFLVWWTKSQLLGPE
jgi:hypothetical protein